MKRNLFIGFWRFKGVVLLNLLLLFCFSCQKEDPKVNLPSVTNDGITFHDGRIIFKDVESFMDHQKWLFENQSNPQLITEKNKLLGLKSMTEYFLEGMKLEEDDPMFTVYVANYPSVFYKEIFDNSTLYLLPHSKLLCYVANKDGIYQVGNLIHRIVGNYIYQISDGDESKIELLFLLKDQISSKEIKIFPSCLNDAKSDYAQRTRYFTDNKYRIVSSLKEYTNGISWWDDIMTNPQKRNWTGTYLRAQLNTKSAIDNGYKAYCPSCQQFPIVAANDVNTGLSQINIAFGGDQIDMSASYCPAYSRGRFDGQYIYVYWPDALDSTPAFTEPNWTPGINEPF